MSEPAGKFSQMGKSLFWISILSEPLFTLYGLISIILYKDLGASAWQIALMTTFKPVITILSLYWSAGIRRHGKVRSNILLGGFLMRAPFLLCPWFQSTWFVIGAAVNYMFFHRAVIPGWMEIIKRNTDQKKRGRLFSLSAAAGYAEGVVLSLGVGAVLDRNPELWPLLFCMAALIGMAVLLIQSKISVEEPADKKAPLPWKDLIFRPWIDSYKLIKERSDFAHYQWGFMICGFGIMLIQPALPVFAVDDLGVSYLMMAGGVSIAKGLGFALSSPIWARWIDRVNILQLASWVFFSVGIFPLLMTCSIWWIGWFYLAYFWYGVGQGGSHLVWHMSGPIFAGKEDSSRFTGAGIMMGGVRGAVGPLLGSWLTVACGSIHVLSLGGSLCIFSGVQLLSNYLERKTILQKY